MMCDDDIDLIHHIRAERGEAMTKLSRYNPLIQYSEMSIIAEQEKDVYFEIKARTNGIYLDIGSSCGLFLPWWEVSKMRDFLNYLYRKDDNP